MHHQKTLDFTAVTFTKQFLKEGWRHNWQLDQQQAIKNKPKEIWEKQGFAVKLNMINSCIKNKSTL